MTVKSPNAVNTFSLYLLIFFSPDVTISAIKPRREFRDSVGRPGTFLKLIRSATRERNDRTFFSWRKISPWREKKVQRRKSEAEEKTVTEFSTKRNVSVTRTDVFPSWNM